MASKRQVWLQIALTLLVFLLEVVQIPQLHHAVFRDGGKHVQLGKEMDATHNVQVRFERELLLESKLADLVVFEGVIGVLQEIWVFLATFLLICL